MKRWVMGAMLFAMACATPGTPKPGASSQDYWPLKKGQRLHFTAHTAGGTAARVIRVKRLSKGWFRVGGQQRLRHDADGLFDGERYLIRHPLKVGTSWNAIPRPGVIERFKVVRVDASCVPTTPLAKRCLAIEARQNIGDEMLLTRWWYGKGAGLLRVEVYVQGTSGALKRQSLLQRRKKAP